MKTLKLNKTEEIKVERNELPDFFTDYFNYHFNKKAVQEHAIKIIRKAREEYDYLNAKIEKNDND